MLRLLNNNDTEIAIEYLLKNEIETIFLYGNIIAMGLENDNSKRRCGDYYGFFKNEELVGIIAFYNLGSCIPHYVDKDAEIPFVGLMKEREYDVVLGMRKIVYPLAELLRETRIEEKIDEDIYMVNNNFSPYFINGEKCLNIDKNLEEHIAFSMRIANECFGETRTAKVQKQILNEKPDSELYLVSTINGKLAAQATIHCLTLKYGQIGGVGTVDELRNNGAAKFVVSKMCEEIIKMGKIPTLMVRKNNLPALRVYETLGFTKYDDYIMVYY